MVENDTGYLIIQTFTAGGGLPVEGAHITVMDMGENGAVRRVLITDRNGQTEKIELPAPDRQNSMSPSGIDNYSRYNIQTDKEGFYPVENLEVPVFGGQTTVQQVSLIPISLGYRAEPQIIDDKEPEDL